MIRSDYGSTRIYYKVMCRSKERVRPLVVTYWVTATGADLILAFLRQEALPQNCHSEKRSDEESHAPDVKILRFTQNDTEKEKFGANLRNGRSDLSILCTRKLRHLCRLYEGVRLRKIFRLPVLERLPCVPYAPLHRSMLPTPRACLAQRRCAWSSESRRILG